jgi:hypothetical protein
MKKTLTVTTLALLAGAASVYAQGQISMADYALGFSIQVFNVQPSGTELMGKTGNTYSTSAGPTVVYAPGTALGTTGNSTYSVQLLVGAGSGDALSALSPVGTPITTWWTPYGTAAGNATTTSLGGMWNPAGANGIASFGTPSEAVTVAIAAWNNKGGQDATLAAAEADPTGAWGFSNTANTTTGGGSAGSPTGLPTSLESFSLATPTPEPSTIALGVIGASALLFRRKK